MQPIITMLQKYTTQIELVCNAVITLLVGFFTIKNFIKFLKAMDKGNRSDAVKSFAWMAGIIIAGIVGWGGIKLLVSNLAPSSDILPRG